MVSHSKSTIGQILNGLGDVNKGFYNWRITYISGNTTSSLHHRRTPYYTFLHYMDQSCIWLVNSEPRNSTIKWMITISSRPMPSLDLLGSHIIPMEQRSGAYGYISAEWKNDIKKLSACRRYLFQRRALLFVLKAMPVSAPETAKGATWL